MFRRPLVIFRYSELHEQLDRTDFRPPTIQNDDGDDDEIMSDQDNAAQDQDQVDDNAIVLAYEANGPGHWVALRRRAESVMTQVSRDGDEDGNRMDSLHLSDELETDSE
eukprot:TRINITY_DN30758_c0_g1_i1.p1 TRINITY_DN30758_c0_g1~~TRINITY_DN30758_c0_g1_i1.p1  ORF type:complete len:109 (-),score=24.31 TRINITY_DN30758_c0_g1_i1:37-363(-)